MQQLLPRLFLITDVMGWGWGGVRTTLFMRRMQALHQNPVPNNHDKHIISREGASDGGREGEVTDSIVRFI